MVRNRNTKTVSAVLCFLTIILTGCMSIQRDVLYSIDGSGSEKSLQEIERNIVIQYLANDSGAILQIKNDLDKLLSQPSSDSAYLSVLNALYADLHLLKRDRINARKYLEIARKYDSADEYVSLVHARLIPNLQNKKQYLEDHIKKNNRLYRLRAELGSVYFQLKDYKKSLAAFDSSLEFLPAAYKELYKNQREHSLRFYAAGDNLKPSSEKIIKKENITLLEMTILAQDNTAALDFITGTAEWSPIVLAQRLKNAGWYNADADFQDRALRRDAALFLWYLISGGNTKALTKYSRFYENKQKLPIPDVELDGLYFDSILGTVEEDIIPLSGGRNFNPEGTFTGLDFYKWLLKADSLR